MAWVTAEPVETAAWLAARAACPVIRDMVQPWQCNDACELCQTEGDLRYVLLKRQVAVESFGGTGFSFWWCCAACLPELEARYILAALEGGNE
jgi:hypothetical protein